MSDRDELDENGRIRMTWTFAIQVGLYIVGIMLAYGALNQRIAVLEYRYERVQSDLNEIKADVKQLLRRP